MGIRADMEASARSQFIGTMLGTPFVSSPWSPLSLGSSLAAWYRADAGCYTDAACLFASASSQYLSKTSPTFAPTTKMTIRVSIKPDLGATDSQAIGFTHSGDTKFLIYIFLGEVRFYVAASAADNSNYAVCGTNIPDGSWAELVIVYDGTAAAADRVAFWVNGVAATSTINGTIPTSLRASAQPLAIGSGFNGALARLGFSSLALSGAALTAAHTSTFWADMTAARQADWFSFYNLCEASSTRVDSTGLNNLTPTNGPTVAAGPGEGACVNNAPRKRIEDASGNARHRTQATIGKQPLYLDAIQNGRAVGRFDGSNDIDATAAIGSFVTQPFTIIGVLKTGNTDGTVQWDGQVGAANRCLLSRGAVALPGGQEISAPTGIAALHTAGDYHTYEATFDGAASSLLVDGATLVSGDAGARVLGAFAVGGNVDDAQYSAMDDCETLIIVGATAAQRASARAYLKQRWATP